MKPVHITIGIVLLLCAILLGDIVVYEGVKDILTPIFSLNLIKTFLAILSFGFIFAFLIGMRYYNILSRTLFILTTTWFGFFIYIFLASLIYILVFIFFDRSYKSISEILILVSLLIGFYGILNAKRIAIKKLEIKLPKLPKEWIDKKIVFISDVHIGLVYGKKHVQKIVGKINELKPDIVFIGGDLFDGISKQKVIDFANPLKDISTPLGVYFVLGNHEKYGNTDAFMEKIKSLGIKILRNQMILINNVQIIGIEYSHNLKKESYRKILSEMNIDKDKLSILIKHDPKDLKISEGIGVDFQISGHTHNAQQWPLNYYAKIFYKKFTYGLHKYKNMQIYTSSGVGTWGPAIRVGSKNEIVEFKFKN